jgi:hypothetical protein
MILFPACSDKNVGKRHHDRSIGRLTAAAGKIYSDSNAAMTARIGDGTFVSAKSIRILSGEYGIVISTGSADNVTAEMILKPAAEPGGTPLAFPTERRPPDYAFRPFL